MQQTTKQQNWLRGLGLALFSLPFLLFTQHIFAAQTCNPNAVATTPTSDFIIHQDGTVTHKKTGLMWKVCTEGYAWVNRFCEARRTPRFPSWSLALQSVELANSGGGYPDIFRARNMTTEGEEFLTPFPKRYTDWRLPNLKELKSIIELTCHSPAINLYVFPDTSFQQGWYWSSTPGASNPFSAWVVNAQYGFALKNGPRAGSPGNQRIGNVRLVRSGQ